MSDESLRELERAFRDGGSEESEVAWLRERARCGERLDWETYSRLHELDVEAGVDYLRWRVSVGDLTRERLELARACGLLEPTQRTHSVSDLAAAYMGVALAHALLPRLPEEHLAEVELALKDALKALEARDSKRLDDAFSGTVLDGADVHPVLEAINVALGPIRDVVDGEPGCPPYLDPAEVFQSAQVESEQPVVLARARVLALRIVLQTAPG